MGDMADYYRSLEEYDESEDCTQNDFGADDWVDAPSGWWRVSSGALVAISAMGYTHLRNAIRWIERRESPCRSGRVYEELIAEVYRRDSEFAATPTANPPEPIHWERSLTRTGQH